MVSNPNFYGQSTTGTPNQIEDGVDFPHTGIIKALSDGLGQNYGISGFDITIDNATQIDVGAGVIFRDGKREAIDAVTNLALISTYTNGYHLVVVNSSNAIVVRNPPAADKVAAFSTGDTIIAMVTHTGNNPMPIQYLTLNKTENSLSVGYDNSGYTESGKVTGDSNSIDITATVTNGNVNLLPNGSGRVNIISTDSNDAELVISKDVAGGIGRAGISLISDNTVNGQSARLTLERTGGSAFIGMDIAADSRDGIRILTGDGSETERIRIDNLGNVGIGTDSPTEKLHLSDADGTEPTIIIENTGTNASEPELVFLRSTATGADSRDIGNIKFKAKDTAGNLHTFAQIMAGSLDADTGTEDGRIVFSLTQGGADNTEFFSMGNLESVFNEGGNDINLRVEGDTDANLLVADAGLDRIGIGTDSPATKLEIEGDTTISRSVDSGQTRTLSIEGARNATGTDYARIDLKNYDSNGPTSYTGARISAINEATGVNDGTLIFSTNNANAGITEAMRITDDRKVLIGTTTAGDGVLTLSGAINTKGRIQNINTVTGDALGPPPVPLYNIVKTDDVILASAPSGSPPNSLTLHLPDAEAEDIGRTYRIVAKDATSGLTLDRTGTDDTVVDTTLTGISLPYTLVTGKIYDIVCIDADMWMLMQLN